MRVSGGRAKAGRERPEAPDAAEIVDRGDALDELRVDVEEAPARGNPGVVDEQSDRRMPCEHASRDLVDLRAVGDVADLPLAADLARDPLELVGAPGEEHAAPAALRELARGRLPDARGGSRDHRDPLPGHRRATLSD